MKKDKEVSFICNKPNCALCKINRRHIEDKEDKDRVFDYEAVHGAKPEIREFTTGATRDSEEGKLDYEGFLSPVVLRRYAEYMDKCRVQSNGKVRDSDNWQKGIPLDVYMKSMWRHFMDVWGLHRTSAITPRGLADLEETLCALNFNVMGYLHELMKTVVVCKCCGDNIETDPRCDCYYRENNDE